MKTRLLIAIALVLATSACGRLGGGFNPFRQAETPPAAPVAAPAAPEAAAETDAAPAPEDTAAAPTDVPEPAPAAAPVEIDPANTEALDSERVICEEKGGRWSRAGGGYSCVSVTRDANRYCTAASQCEGYCLSRSRTCSPVKPLFGCHDVMAPGGGTQSICMN